MREEVCLGLVVVNYFSAASVVQLVDSIDRLIDDKSGVALVVVDNSVCLQECQVLEDGLAQYRDEFALLRVVASAENGGYAAGNNLGMRMLIELGAEIVVIANPDIIFRRIDIKGLLEELRRPTPIILAFETKQDGIVGSGLGAVSRVSGRSRVLKESERRLGGKWVVYPGGHCIAALSSTWKSLGGFSEDFFLYDEEPDLAIRLAKMDGVVRQSQSIAIYHESGLTTASSTDELGKSETTLFHSSRSSIILFRKHAALRTQVPIVVLARLAYSFSHLISGRPRRALAVLRGVGAGVAWRPSNDSRLRGQEKPT